MPPPAWYTELTSSASEVFFEMVCIIMCVERQSDLQEGAENGLTTRLPDTREGRGGVSEQDARLLCPSKMCSSSVLFTSLLTGHEVGGVG